MQWPPSLVGGLAGQVQANCYSWQWPNQLTLPAGLKWGPLQLAIITAQIVLESIGKTEVKILYAIPIIWISWIFCFTQLHIELPNMFPTQTPVTTPSIWQLVMYKEPIEVQLYASMTTILWVLHCTDTRFYGMNMHYSAHTKQGHKLQDRQVTSSMMGHNTLSSHMWTQAEKISHERQADGQNVLLVLNEVDGWEVLLSLMWFIQCNH